MAVKLSELEIDGVLCEVFDIDAVHVDELADILSRSAIRQVIGNLFFPVGSIYMTASDTNPATLFGGTWEPVQGRVIMGADGNHPVNSIGGSEDSIVPSHNHYVSFKTESGGSHTHSISGTALAAGSHQHGLGANWSSGSGSNSAYKKDSNRTIYTRYTDAAGSHTHALSGSALIAGAHQHDLAGYSDNTGVSGVGKNNMPYVAYYIWRRTA